MNWRGPSASHVTAPQRQRLCVMRAVWQVRFRRARRFPRRPLRGKRRWLLELMRRAAPALGAAAVVPVALEVVLRVCVTPAPHSAGRLFGSELPPVQLIPPEPPRPARRDAQPGRIRFDDLSGLVRDDVVLGYTSREHAISTNGWWQSNNVGARARRDTAATTAPGTTRVLVSGDSFAAGSRVPQESAWPAVLEAADPGLEVVNFGVDGYSLAQSLLRYRGVGASLAHDVVILTLSPRADLWREVNTLRALAGWRSYRVMPRFVLDDGLKLVPSPYDPPSAVHADNPSRLGSPPSSRGTVSRASTSPTRSSPHPPSASTAATTGRTTARAPTPWSPVSSGTHSPHRRRWPAVPPGREGGCSFTTRRSFGSCSPPASPIGACSARGARGTSSCSARASSSTRAGARRSSSSSSRPRSTTTGWPSRSRRRRRRGDAVPVSSPRWSFRSGSLPTSSTRTSSSHRCGRSSVRRARRPCSPSCCRSASRSTPSRPSPTWSTFTAAGSRPSAT